MLYHHHIPAPDSLAFPGIREVARWPEPTRVLVLTDRSGVRRLRVEMMESDVITEALQALCGVLEVIEAATPEPVASSDVPSSVERELQLVVFPPR